MTDETTSGATPAVDAEMLRSFYDRRHPLYYELVSQWAFFWSSYKGGRKWFDANIFRFHKEGDTEFGDRLARAYRFNHTREVIDILQKYLFKAPITRNLADAPDSVKKFWLNTTRAGVNIDQAMRQIATFTSALGRIAVVVDNNLKPADNSVPLSEAQVATSGYRTYACAYMAWDVLDYAYDEDGDGELLWIKLREIVRDDGDPFKSSGNLETRVRLWTRTGWMLYEEKETEASATLVVGVETSQKMPEVVLKDSGTHTLGYVPVRLADHILLGEAYSAPSLIEDIAYLDRAVANYLSNLDAIIQDQTFSQLAIPAQAMASGEDPYKKILEMGTKRIFTYDGGAGSTAKPEFLSPDPKQAGVILAVINKIIAEIYQTIGLAGERTKQDNAVGIDNSSGVAKAYDFERVNSLLLAKAQACENLENWMAKCVADWNGQGTKLPVDTRLVTYPSTFDVARLADELATAEALQKVDAPMEIRSEQFKVVIDKIFPQIAADLRQNLYESLKTWKSATEKSQEFQLKQAEAKASQTDTSKPVAGSRQGEVTSTTK